MEADGSRRFTEREVALVLRKATEMEEAPGGGAPDMGGLSLRELEQIATEVGISPASIRRAVTDLDTRRGKSELTHIPLTRQAMRGVEGELDQEDIARLIQHVEGSSDQVGVVTEALGGTQWTARDRFRTTQVSITPAKGETRVRVVERATSRLRRVLHAFPAAAGMILVGGFVGGLDPSSQVAAAAMMAGAATGGLLGRVLWSRMSARSAARVERLAAELSSEAEDALR